MVARTTLNWSDWLVCKQLVYVRSDLAVSVSKFFLPFSCGSFFRMHLFLKRFYRTSFTQNTTTPTTPKH